MAFNQVNQKLSGLQIFKVLSGIFLFAIILLIIIAISSNKSPNKTVIPLQAKSISKTTFTDLDRYKSNYIIERFVADGVSNILSLSNSYDDVTVKLNGEIQLFSTCPHQTYNLCYDFSGKRFIFRSAPFKDSEITVRGFPLSK